MSETTRFGAKRVLNAMGVPTILGANVCSQAVRQAVDEILQVSVEIDELQAAACRTIAAATGAEGGCVTSSCSSGLVIAAAAAMAGADLAKVARLPDTDGLRDEIVLPLGHDINFGAPISQMIRMSGAKVVRPGTANHCEGFHLRGALSDRTAALFYVDSGDVNPDGAFASVEDFVEIAHAHGVPLVVDMAAGLDVRPFLATGADLVITSAHKQMGAPTSGMICGKLDLVRACYLQNYGVGRAMKVGKEGVAG
ncbi:MAG: aminotransferase class V-fold PLP-dependent enzyme, partial [Acidobacteria bacterium]|nr:aminotransferase class V-fold PLP-dependent enzyme [Acidobacteriota bacterium]